MNFKEFLRKKGISEADFATKSAEEIAQLQAEYNAEMKADTDKKIENVKAEAFKAAKDVVAEAFKEKPDGISSEDFNAYKAEMEEQFKNLEKAIGKTNPNGNDADAVKLLTDKYEKLYEKSNDPEVQNEINTVQNKHARAKFEVEHKAFADTNIHSVSAPGTTNPVSDLYAMMASQVIGRYTKPKPVTAIMDHVNVHPLNAATLVIFEDSVTGNFAITPECQLKPWVQYQEKDVYADAEIVTALWCTTNKLRRFYPEIANRMRQTFEKLLMETIPEVVMAYFRANASAFTPITGLRFDTPGEYEVIVAMATALRKAGYMPDSVILSSVDYAKLVTKRTTDGIYTLQNGNSIMLVGDQIIVGSYKLKVIEDPTFADGEIAIGDLSVIHVGLDSQLIYLETDGRVDGESTIKTGLAVNVRTHELGKYVAVLMADGAKAAIVRDTFANVKTLITA